jgi:hypothetical protein
MSWFFNKVKAAQHVSGNILPSRGGYVSSWKHIHLGFYKETGGCDCSLNVLLTMGKMLPETC